MAAFIDLTSRKFGRLTVLRRDGLLGNKPAWQCVCDCGNTQLVRGSDLRLGKHKSCGCLHKEIVTKHGGHGTHEYTCWQSMKDRCFNTNAENYDRYGARGITVCQRWWEFATFLKDIGHAPTPEHTIDRIDNDGIYEPRNCRWATRFEQAQNRSPRRTQNIVPRDRITGRFVSQ